MKTKGEDDVKSAWPTALMFYVDQWKKCDLQF